MADPYTGLAQVRPTGPAGPDPSQQIHVSPDMFGGQVGAGLEKFGQGATKAAEVFDQVVVEDMSNQYQDMVTKLLHGDPSKTTVGPDGKPVADSGYFGKKGRAALDDRPAVEKQMEEFQKEISGKIISLNQRRAFTSFANNYRLSQHGRIAGYADQQAAVYAEHTNDASAKLQFRNVSINPDDPATLLAAREDVRSAYVRNVQLRGGGPEEVREAIARADQDVLQAQVTAIGATDPIKALRIVEKNRALLGPAYVPLHARFKSEANAAEADDLVAGYMGATAIPDAVRKFDPLIQQASSQTGISPALGYGLISQESRGNPNAISPAGARGLTQLMPGTAADLGVTNPHDPAQAIPAGFRYLKQQIDKYGSERAGLMAYNWGPGHYEKWVRDGSDPDRIPQETRDFVRRVQGYAASYGSRVDVKAAQLDILNRTDIPAAVKASAYAKIEKQSAAVEAMKTAQVKSLDDTLEATTQTMIAAPTTYKRGTLAMLADSYEAAGDRSAAVNTRILAANEDALLTFATSSESAQRRILEGLLPGKAKALAAGILAADEKTRGEAGKVARSEFDAIKEAAEKGNIPIGTMVKKIGDAVDMAVRSGDPLLPRQIYEYADARAKAESIGKAGPTGQEQLLTDLRSRIEEGEQANASIKQLDFAQEISRKQKEAFAQDAFSAGTSLYPEVGKPVPINWGDKPDSLAAALAMRASQARQISSRREGLPVIPFTVAEVEGLRNHLDKGPPDLQASLLKTLALSPPDMLPGIAATLAGKKETSDQISRSYAAALGIYWDKDPATAPIADQILRGASIIRTMGANGKEPPTASPIWNTTFQESLGNIFRDMGDRVPAEFAAAVASIYAYQMQQAGKQGVATPDPAVMRKAIEAVGGKPVTLNGQSFFPPVRGMDAYGVDAALRTLTPGDMDGLRTLEGDPITPEVVRNRGVLTNVGEGRYKVRVPDPRRGGDLSEVLDPATGRAWVLDMKPLVQRSRIAPSVDPNAPDYVRAPALGGRPPATE